MKTFREFMLEVWKNEYRDSAGAKSWLSRGLIGKKRSAEDFTNSGYRKVGSVSAPKSKKKIDLYRRASRDYSSNDPIHHYVGHDPETGTVTHSISGYNNKGRSLTNIAASSSGDHPVKMHDVYHHILKHGHQSTLVGDNQSQGAMGVWNKLSKKSGTTIHGWSKGKPVNLGRYHNDADEDETHTPMYSKKGEKHDSEDVKIGNMKLVASYNKKRGKK